MFKFGDVIYRPCLSYAGKKNFVSTQIVLESFVKGEKHYIRSIDFVGQTWTDRVTDLGETFFYSRENAEKELKILIKKKEEMANV